MVVKTLGGFLELAGGLAGGNEVFDAIYVGEGDRIVAVEAFAEVILALGDVKTITENASAEGSAIAGGAELWTVEMAVQALVMPAARGEGAVGEVQFDQGAGFADGAKEVVEIPCGVDVVLDFFAWSEAETDGL